MPVPPKGTSEYQAYLDMKQAAYDQYKTQQETAGAQERANLRGLNVAALLNATDTGPEVNPRNTSGEVLSNIYRELGRLRGDVSYLKQK